MTQLRGLIEASRDIAAGIYWRVQPAGLPLTEEHESWPWGVSREDAEEADEVLPGAACCGSPEQLVEYWENRGGVGPGMEVVVFRGRYSGNSGDSDVAVPEDVLLRVSFEELRRALDA